MLSFSCSLTSLTIFLNFNLYLYQSISLSLSHTHTHSSNIKCTTVFSNWICWNSKVKYVCFFSMSINQLCIKNRILIRKNSLFEVIYTFLYFRNRTSPSLEKWFNSSLLWTFSPLNLLFFVQRKLQWELWLSIPFLFPLQTNIKSIEILLCQGNIIL